MKSVRNVVFFALVLSVSAASAAPAAGPFAAWKAAKGKWRAVDDLFVQTDMSSDCRAFAPAAKWTDYVYEVKARKISGNEGFLILFRVQDHSHFYWWNIGGWGNSGLGLETRGKGASFPRVKGKVQTGKWYDVKVVVRGPSIKCYLDGKRIHDARSDAYGFGGVGLGTWATQVEYKDVQVTTPDGLRLYGASQMELVEESLRRLGRPGEGLRTEFNALHAAGVKGSDAKWAALYRKAAAIQQRIHEAGETLAKIDLERARKDILALIDRAPASRAEGVAILKQIDDCQKRVAKLTRELAAGADVPASQIDSVIAFANKAAAFARHQFVKRCPPVAFIKRRARGRNGTNATMHGRMTGVGSAICVYDPARPETGARTIFEDKTGFVFDMSPSYDGKKLVFAYKKDVPGRSDPFHVYEINVDPGAPGGMRQLTKGRFHDFSPVYLPDGRIVFNSTRVESYSLCQDFIAAAMYVIDGDGRNMRRIEYNTLCDLTPYVMDDGSILFTRWEYQDKNIFCTEGLWTLNPDGSRLQLFYGNTLTIPNAIYGAKQIPGTKKVIAVMAAHHHPPLGGICMIDRTRGIESTEAMTVLTPDVPYRPTKGRHWKETNWGPGDRLYPWSYTDPWPVEKDLFLVSYGGGGVNRYRLYLMDDRGEKVMLYEEAKTSCYCPVPLRPRPLPAKLPGQVPQPAGEGVFFVSDVYQGLLGSGVKRGDVTAIRVLSHTPKKYNTEGPRYHDHYPAMSYGSYYTKVCYGTVPVSPEGMAYFKAPAGVELYFEAVDKTGKEIRRMGTVTQITAGEYQSCIGCHESRTMSPPPNAAAMRRLARGPDAIQPPPWGAGAISYVKQVQPALDRHCVKCHSGRNPKAGMDLSGDKTRLWSMSYKSLIDRRLVDFYYINPGPTGNFPPLASGARVSRLTKVIESNHNKVNMDDESRRRIFNWIDANCPYYDTWEMSRPWSLGGRDAWAVPIAKRGRPPMAPWFTEFQGLMGKHCGSCHGHTPRNTWINLTRPEYSRVLNAHLSKKAGGMGIDKPKNRKKPLMFNSTSDPIYQAMLRTLQAGKAALDKDPRMDSPGGKPIPQDRDFGRTY